MLAVVGGRPQCACSILKHRLPWPTLASATPLPFRPEAMCSSGQSVEFGSGWTAKSLDGGTASPSRKRRQSAMVQLNLLGQPTAAAASKRRNTKRISPRKPASQACGNSQSSGRQPTRGPSSGARSSPRVPAEQGGDGVTNLGEQAAVNYLSGTWSPDVGNKLLKELQASLPCCIFLLDAAKRRSREGFEQIGRRIRMLLDQ